MSNITQVKQTKHLFFWMVCTGCILYSNLLAAQQQDSIWQSEQIAQARVVYDRQFSGPNSPVYQGYQYVPFILPASGDPFYPNAKWHSGSVVFKGHRYADLSLLYDVLKDQLVLKSAGGLYRILLDAEHVDGFTLDSLRFIHIHPADSMHTSLPPAGYYELLISGNPVQLLVKRKKTVEDPVTASQTRTFRSKSVYYIKKADTYYRVRSKHSVLKALKDQRRAIRRYLRKQHIYFNTEREQAVKRAVIFFNNRTPHAS